MIYESIVIVENHLIAIFKYLGLFIISFISNLFSALSGGGAGLIQLPALLLFGTSYPKALASHKIATVALGLGGSINNFYSIRKNLNVILQILIFGLPGVFIGASVVDFLSEDILYLLLGLFSIFLSYYSFKEQNFGLQSKNSKITSLQRIRFISLLFLIGLLNGSISSGTGLLVTILLIKTFKIDFIEAISITFLTVGIVWNLVGAIALSRIEGLPFDIVVVLVFGSFIGGYFGAYLSKLKGNNLVKNCFTSVSFLVGLTLLIKSTRLLFKN